MRIKSLTVQGFRGFNERREIAFDDKLTLIHGPNSYGKTSISEALEWLVYGVTSKVEKADSKEEYKGSYRNLHFPEGATPFVKAIFVDDSGSEVEFRGDMSDDEALQRLVDGEVVETWPVDQDLYEAPKPFILQHALKRLLLVPPKERFRGFAGLLGLEELEVFWKNVVSVCTKPQACVPSDVNRVRKEVVALRARCESEPSLGEIGGALTEGVAGVAKAYEAVELECKSRVPAGTRDQSVMPELLRMREEAAAKLFDGCIALEDYSHEEKQVDSADEELFLRCTEASFVDSYCELAGREIVQHLLERAQFFDLGVELLASKPTQCPFCGEPVDEALANHIHVEHQQLMRQRDQCSALDNQRTEVAEPLKEVRRRVGPYHERNALKASDLLQVEDSMDKLKSILSPKHQDQLDVVEETLRHLSAARTTLHRLRDRLVDALVNVESSVAGRKEDTELVKVLGERLQEYVAETRSYRQVIAERAAAMSDADQILRHELDVLAGTQDIATLIDLVERRGTVEKALTIDDILADLKHLRRSVDEFVATEVLQKVSGELSAEVMDWYGRIRTEGDPDVHFSGFDVPVTRKGKLKAGRIDVKATSYGQELVSAVSSLSESKLNALGLCICIATNVMSDSPFKFLVIDDPIQSWDAEHETQFIEVVRQLVQRGNQVILMSHNRHWLDLLCAGCRTVNGRYYEITGYTQAGPHIQEISWARWHDRLKEVDAILKDDRASTVKLQQAEEEIRIVTATLTSELYLARKGVSKSPHALNRSKVRKMLLECGVDSGLVDRVCQTFGTTDDAHHAPKKYAPDRQRIRAYHSYCHELAKLLDG